MVSCSHTESCGVVDGDDSQGSDGSDEDVVEGNALPPALNGGTVKLGSHPEAQSSSDADSDEEEEDGGDEEEDGDEQEEEADGGQEGRAVGEEQEEEERTA